MLKKLILAAIFLPLTFSSGVSAENDCVRQEYMKSYQTPQGLNRISSIIKRVNKDVFYDENGEYLSYSVADNRLINLLYSYKAYPPIEYTGYEIIFSSLRRVLTESMKRHSADTVQSMSQMCVDNPECYEKDSLLISLFKPGKDRPFIIDFYRWSASGFRFEKTKSFEN